MLNDDINERKLIIRRHKMIIDDQLYSIDQHREQIAKHITRINQITAEQRAIDNIITLCHTGK